MLKELERAILSGPPRKMFKDDIEIEELGTFVDRHIWLRLSKIDNAGVNLSDNVKNQLGRLSKKHPKWIWLKINLMNSLIG